jgi:hypothetical protein
VQVLGKGKPEDAWPEVVAGRQLPFPDNLTSLSGMLTSGGGKVRACMNMTGSSNGQFFSRVTMHERRVLSCGVRMPNLFRTLAVANFQQAALDRLVGVQTQSIAR